MEFSSKLQENPTIFFILKIISLFSVSYRIFFQINKIILFFKVHKVFLIDPIYITYDS